MTLGIGVKDKGGAWGRDSFALSAESWAILSVRDSCSVRRYS